MRSLDLSLLPPLTPFLKILRVHQQQAKRLAVVLALVGMVRPVRPQDGPAVLRVQLPEPRKPLVDVHIVDEEIDGAINRDAQPDEEQPGVARESAKQDAGDAGRGKDEEKKVVLLEPAALLKIGAVVVFVPLPAEAVHDVLMGEPRHELHAAHCGEGDEDCLYC